MHHFEGYTRADGETFDGGVLGFAITSKFEGPGTWYDAVEDEWGSSSDIRIDTDSYGVFNGGN